MYIAIVLPPERVLYGRENGRKVRKLFDLDRLDTEDQEVRVIISVNTLSLNSSFFIGCFLDSMIHLDGEISFNQKYRFFCDDIIEKMVEDGISRCEKTLEIGGDS